MWHAGRVLSILKAWPERRVKAICLTDGERVGSLGDLGVQVGSPCGAFFKLRRTHSNFSAENDVATFDPDQLAPLGRAWLLDVLVTVG